MSIWHSKRAFTYLEMIVVLAIISIIMFTMGVSINKFHTNNQINQVVKIIGSKYNYTKNKAVIQKQECQINFLNDKFNVKCNDDMLYEYQCPSGMIITTNFINDQIKINTNGHIQRGGTITIKIDNHIKKMKFGIGDSDYAVE